MTHIRFFCWIDKKTRYTPCPHGVCRAYQWKHPGNVSKECVVANGRA